MPCTTILVGKKASNDNSTMIARTDDGSITVKKLVKVTGDKQKRKYTSVIGHLTLDLPDEALACTYTPNVLPGEGMWPTTGINELNVGMTAPETITTNPRVLGADPMVRYIKAKTKKEKDIPGGIGEEDLVALVLPYIKTAREGVLRMGELLEKYGTYESNGIAFNDADEIWYMETIGGHHWMARRVPDDAVVIMPNQLGIDCFDFDDAFGKQKEFLCSADLREFIKDNYLDLNTDGPFNPRWCFGSHSDADHVYNTPRAWFMGRCLCPTKYKWDGPDADFGPESDNIPWCFVPEKKITVEDVKYILSSYYQGTPYYLYSGTKTPEKGIYRPIAKNNTDTMGLCQIRADIAGANKSIEWVCFGCTAFDTFIPVYTAGKVDKYLSDTKADVSTDSFYWNSRLIDVLADANFNSCIQHIERYQNATMARAHAIIAEYDKKFEESGDVAILDEANKKLCEMGREETQKVLNNLVLEATRHMKTAFSRTDN